MQKLSLSSLRYLLCLFFFSLVLYYEIVTLISNLQLFCGTMTLWNYFVDKNVQANTRTEDAPAEASVGGPAIDNRCVYLFLSSGVRSPGSINRCSAQSKVALLPDYLRCLKLFQSRVWSRLTLPPPSLAPLLVMHLVSLFWFASRLLNIYHNIFVGL